MLTHATPRQSPGPETIAVAIGNVVRTGVREIKRWKGRGSTLRAPMTKNSQGPNQNKRKQRVTEVTLQILSGLEHSLAAHDRQQLRDTDDYVHE
jgi:hypothetical protein